MICLSYYWFVGHSDGARAPSFEHEVAKLSRLVEAKEMTVEQLNIQLLHKFAQTIPTGQAWSMLAEKARGHGVYIVGGSGPELANGKIYHTSPVFGPRGELIGKHRKSILWDRELPFVTPGDDWEVFDIAGAKIGIAICSEGQYVPEITRLLALRGAEVLVVPNGVHLSKNSLLAIPITRAIECQSYYMYIGQIPIGWRFPEVPKYTSCIVSPINHLNPALAVGEDKGCVLFADLDVDRLRKERALKTPILNDYRFANAVNDMVAGKYSYPMLTEHFLKSKRRDQLLAKILEAVKNSSKTSENLSSHSEIDKKATQVPA